MAKGLAEQKLQKARTYLTTRYPFCASFVLERDFRVLTGAPLGMPPGMPFRAATDGRTIMWSRKWVEDDLTTHDELVFVMAHEAMHIALGHHVRRHNRCPLGWNIATDYVINAALRDDGYYVPADVLLDAKYNGMSSERVFDLVMQEVREEREKQQQSQGGGDGAEQQGDGSGCGDPQCPIHQGQGDGRVPYDWVSDLKHEDGSALSEAERQQVKRELEVEVQKAAQMERAFKQVGKGSASADRATRASRAQVRWQDELQHLLLVTRRDDYTYQRPNRRYLQQGIYAPSLCKPSLGTLIVGVDTSGSVGSAELAAFAAEGEALLRAFPGTTLVFVFCDTQINGVQVATVEDIPLTLEANGGGGTSFHPVFEWVEENRAEYEPAALVYLTDLCVYDFPDEPDYPVIWVSTEKDRTNPWGNRVNIDIHA